MPEGVEVKIEGMDELIKKLDKLGKMSTIHAGMKAAANILKGLMTVYPDETAANFPDGPGSSWYQRGKGSLYWRIRDNARVSYGKKSEVLSSKWTMKYNESKSEATIGTNVSYAKFVQGPKGTQAKAMAKIGWRGVDVVANKELPRIQEMLFAAVKRAIGAA